MKDACIKEDRRAAWIPAVIAAAAFSMAVHAGDSPSPLKLEKALELARKRNEDFLISKEQLKQTLLLRNKAWSAFLPVVTLSGTYTHSDKEIIFNNRVILKQDALAGKAMATLTFLNGPSIAGLLEAVEAAEAGVENTRWAMNELSFEVARAYYSVLSAENLVAAYERSVETAQEHLDAVRSRMEAGEALAVDETRAEMELVTAKSDLVNARNALASAADYLAFLLGYEPPLVLEEPRPVEPPGKTNEELVAHALSHRPDLAASKHEVKAAKKAADGSWTDFLPSLGLTGTFNATENTSFSGDPFSWNLVVFAEWILWDGGYALASGLENRSKLEQAKLEQKKLFRNVKIEVRQARRDVENAVANMASAGKKLGLAEATREMVLGRYHAGLATSLELTEADDQLRQAEVQVVAQELAHSLSLLELLRVIGLDPLGKEIEKP